MSGELIVICTGKTGRKYINDEGEQADVTPFVGSDNDQLGIGIFVTRADGTEKAWIWGLLIPHLLIRSWRAMKLLEAMPRIRVHGSLSHCWSLACDPLHSGENKYLDEEGALFGNYDKFREARAQILAAFPSTTMLKNMLKVIDKHGLQVSNNEIQMCRSKLAAANIILERLCVADEARRRRAEVEANANAKREADRIKIAEAVMEKRKSFFRRWFF
ncbi:hypothetical protein A2392_00465 [Candidatus Kaiserbacteria bacterium RIFOXYB1_FULL_46_14]|uniref:Uncharacterized protein n=1 Tax=Candidatus Kaiserbacteria bacterium RIFOXYB1_FULL_46_14 TaxID=1798531 RepID=A0A1F6FJ42_9BACT|nr:MAG: hypothetical protein A2392_00465 [Candidatus Kaiserbacteria bacterium RIFOXYB1_FULL_46_14]